MMDKVPQNYYFPDYFKTLLLKVQMKHHQAQICWHLEKCVPQNKNQGFRLAGLPAVSPQNKNQGIAPSSSSSSSNILVCIVMFVVCCCCVHALHERWGVRWLVKCVTTFDPCKVLYCTGCILENHPGQLVIGQWSKFFTI